MAFEFGDVVLVPCPLSNLTASKQPLAAVVSTRAHGLEIPDLILIAITSQLRPTPALGEIWLRFWQVAGLLKPSVIKAVIATLEQRIVIRRLGRPVEADDATLRTAIVQMMADRSRPGRCGVL